MTTTSKLNGLQLILLATAAQRDDGSLLPPPEALGDQGARIRRALPPLIKRALVVEADVTDAERAWRSDGERHIGAFVTDAGRAIVGADQHASAEAGADTPANDPSPQIGDEVPRKDEGAPKPASKIAQVIALLERGGGATLDEMIAATGWLPHTTRAALTGLRKKGHVLAKGKRGALTCYRIAKAA